MLRKICVVLAVFSVFLVSSCAPDEGPYKDSKKTGNYFFAEVDPLWGAFVVEGLTVELPITDITFNNEPIGVGEATDVFVNNYSLEFYPTDGCTVGPCPPLSTINGLPLSILVPAGGKGEVLDAPMAMIETLEEFLLNTTATSTQLYRVRATFNGKNEFGYKVSTSIDYGLMISP